MIRYNYTEKAQEILEAGIFTHEDFMISAGMLLRDMQMIGADRIRQERAGVRYEIAKVPMEENDYFINIG